MKVFTSGQNNESRLKSLIWPVFRQRLGHLALFSAVINLLMLAPAVYMLQVYDRVLASGNEMTLLMLTLMVLVLFAFMGVLEWLRSVVVIRLGTRLDLTLNRTLFNAVYQARLSRRQQNAEQALNDLTQLRQFATGNALFAFFDAPWFPLYLLVMFLFHPLLGGLALLGAVCLIALAWLNHKIAEPALDQASQLSLQANQQAGSQLRNADVVAAMGMLPDLTNRWLSQHTQFLAWQNFASECSGQISAASRALRLALQSLVLGLGAWLVLQQQISAGMMIAASILMGRVLAPIDLLIAVWKQYSSARQAYVRLERLLQHYPAEEQRLALPEPSGELLAQGATVLLPGSRTALLKQLNFALNSGESLGVLGASGSGKSTLARLLSGALTTDDGVLRIDGADIRHWDQQQLGRYIGYLPQDVQLFSGTVADNIARFSAPYDSRDEDIVSAARMAGVHELIQQLPQGYDTWLGDQGQGLSGGQKQRLALARALFRLPRIIVLDEPDASLDQAGEMALLQTLQRIREAGCTLIMVSHKARLLDGVDKLMVLEQGRIRAFGSPQKVLDAIAAPATSGAAAPHTAASHTSSTAATMAGHGSTLTDTLMPSISLSYSSGHGES